jgi:hypothetical protein
MKFFKIPTSVFAATSSSSYYFAPKIKNKWYLGENSLANSFLRIEKKMHNGKFDAIAAIATYAARRVAKLVNPFSSSS